MVAQTRKQGGGISVLRSGIGRVSIALWLAIVGTAPAYAQSRVRVSADISDCLNVRSRPETSSARKLCLTPGTEAEVRDSVPFWLRIRVDNGTLGWAAKRYLVRIEGSTPAPAESSPAVTVQANAWLEVHVVDVGQGDGIWIHTFDDSVRGNGMFEGKNIVIDGGPDASDDKNEMLHYLQRRLPDGSLIDALIISHPHDDHYPGAAGVLNHFEISDYYDPAYPKEGPKYNNFLALVGSEIARGQPIHLHMGKAQFGVPDWGSELKPEFLYSYPGNPSGLGSGNTLENNASIVLKLTYGDVSFLFMGDAEGKNRSDSPTTPKYAERILLNEFPASRLKSTVLKIAHHGSESSSTLPFIQAVDPEIVLVSSGRKAFGGTFLPDRSTLQRYCAHNPQIRIYRTDQDDEAEQRTTANDQDGDNIVVRTNGRTVQVQAFSNGHPLPAPTACSP